MKRCLKVTTTNVLFCPQPEDVQFTVTEEERHQKSFTFKKLKSENFLEYDSGLRTVHFLAWKVNETNQNLYFVVAGCQEEPPGPAGTDLLSDW